MALVRIAPTPARIRWNRSADRPSELRWDDHQVDVIGLETVRDERAAYPAERGPRVTLVLRTGDGGRASVAYDGRRWTIDAIEPAA